MNYHKSWTPAATESFERVIAAHGGWKAWNDFDSVTLKVKELRGFLPALKGFGTTFFAPDLMRIDPKKRTVEFDYGTHVDTFHDGKVGFSPEKHIAENGRNLFTGSTFEKWQPQHSLYFFGYAWANYIGYPFILPEHKLLSWKHGSATSEYIIEFPESFHTHSPVQTFYFHSNQLLYRHDYRATVAGPIFFGAHFTEGYQDYKGIKIACVRKVRPRIFKVPMPLHGIYAEVEIA